MKFLNLSIRIEVYKHFSIETIGVNYMVVKRGDMFYADLSPVVGSEQGGIRPVIIIQNDVGNMHSPTVIAAAITSQRGKNKLPTHIEINSKENGLKSDSIVLTEQIRTIDKSRLKEKIGHVDDDKIMSKINNALGVSFGLEI
jgi:mRNA interferase MazF